ncbi:FAD-dependent oxidoreductase [Methylocaldum sp.]|uniref:FAD-dependent oxidoreductase n=1 Tax=Methylocaldum sp. TaxID=1969727 RepID=UPI002D5874E9|nr:FAD-dependent oxidoreductase [Methylocaldum sp.]HYE34049.1 FAD-dependent oxidoreductase [Methylocaldum sp.]
MGIGGRPDSELATAAGLELGALGGIRVNEYTRISDAAIWAVGDVVEVKNRVTGKWQLVPLAGPANRQGRIAATAILHHFSCSNGETPPLAFEGVLGTAVCEVFGLTVAVTGANAQNLPLETLRDRLHELPRDRDIWLVCGVGQRAYYAFRVLMQNGLQVKVLSGGMQTYQSRMQASG